MMFQGLLSVDNMLNAGMSKGTGRQALSGTKGLFLSLMAQMIGQQGMTYQATVKGGDNPLISLKDLQNNGKGGLLNLLKTKALSLDGNLDNQFVGEAALTDIENFLVGAGFDPQAVASIMEKLKTKMGGRELPLSDVFESLKSLKTPEEDDMTDTIADISLLPYIETSLQSLGLPPSKIADIVKDSKIEGVGVDLKRLVAGLKKVAGTYTEERQFRQMTGNANGQSPWAETVQGSRDDYIKQTMARLGVEKIPVRDRAMTLDDFISGIETLVSKQGATSEAAQALNNDLKRFFDKIRMGKDVATETQAFGLKDKALNGKDNRRNDGVVAKSAEKKMAIGRQDEPGSEVEPDLVKEQIENLISPDKQSGELSAKTEIRPGFEKMAEDAPNMKVQMSREDGAASFDTLIRDVNNPDRQAMVSDARPTARTLPMYVVDQVGKQIVRAVNNGENEIRIQIKPPQLGRLHMAIDHSSDGIKISILAEHRSTKELILANMNELRGTMLDQGLRVNTIDVQVSPDFQQAMQDMRHREGNTKEKNREGKEGVGEGVKENVSIPADGAEMLVQYGQGRLNLVA